MKRLLAYWQGWASVRRCPWPANVAVFVVVVAFLAVTAPAPLERAQASHDCGSGPPNCGPDSVLIDMQKDDTDGAGPDVANRGRVLGGLGTEDGGEGDQSNSQYFDTTDNDGDGFVDEGNPVVGQRQSCIQIWEDDVLNADEDGMLGEDTPTASVDRAEIDVVVHGIPASNRLLGFHFQLNYSEAGDDTPDGLPASLRVNGGSEGASDSRYLLFAEPGSGIFGTQELNQGNETTTVDGIWLADNLDASVAATEEGDGVLARIRLESMAGGTAGFYQIWLSNAYLLDANNDAQLPDATTSEAANMAFVAISYDGLDGGTTIGDSAGELFNCTDSDGDGTPDGADDDDDDDGVPDVSDNCPTVANANGQSDADGDLAGDACDGPGSGNVDCSPPPNGVTSVDALKVLRHSAGLSVAQSEPCMDIGAGPLVSGWVQGDVNCSGGVTPVNAVDALLILRRVAGLSVNVPALCPPIIGPPP